MVRRRPSVKSDGGESRCEKTDGKRWRCPMPALLGKNFCSNHRLLEPQNPNRTQPDSDPQNPNRIQNDSDPHFPSSDNPNEAKKSSDPQVLSSDNKKIENRGDSGLENKKRARKKKEVAVSDLENSNQVLENSSEEENEAEGNAGNDSDVEILNTTLRVFKTNKKRRKKDLKEVKIENEVDSGLDPITDDSDSILEELMRMAVKRQMERREEKSRRDKEVEEEEEVRRELPNGVMAISPPRMVKSLANIIDRKIGSDEGWELKRRFRSKNVEAEPVAVVKKLPMRKGKRKSTRKSGKTSMQMGIEAGISKGLTNGHNKASSIGNTDYLLGQLLPILKQPNWEQIFELEIEAKNQGKGLTGVRLQVIECSQEGQFKCNFCRTPVVKLHRSCSRCCYKLCTSCCREIRGESLPLDFHVAETHYGIKKEPLSDKSKDKCIPCPPSVLGGCGVGILIMRLLLPFGLLQQPCSTKVAVTVDGDIEPI